MKGASLVIAVALSVVVVGLSGFSRAEEAKEKDVKAAAPATAPAAAGPSTTSPAEKDRLMKMGEEEAKKIVAAKVNGVNIALDEVIKMMNRIGGQVSAHKGGAPDFDQIKKAALDRLILQELAFQQAAALGIKPEQKDIDDTMADVIAKSGGAEAFKNFLEKQKLTEAMVREDIRRSLILQRVYAKEVLDKSNVPEDKLKEEYEKDKSKFKQPEKISLVDVVIFLDAKDKGADAKAEAILKKIKENNDDPFKLAQDSSYVVRTYFPDKDKDKEMIEAARKMKEGDVSGIIRQKDGLHIIKLMEYSPEKQLTFDEAKGIIETKFKTAAQMQRMKEWTEELKKGAKIEIMDLTAALQKSDQPKPEEVKPEQSKSEQPKPEEVKPEPSKSEQPKSEEVKPEAAKPDEVKQK